MFKVCTSASLVQTLNFVCVCTCMHAVHACTDTCLQKAYMHAYIHAHTQAYINAFSIECVLSTCMRTYMRAHKHTQMHAQNYTHTIILSYTHTHTCMPSASARVGVGIGSRHEGGWGGMGGGGEYGCANGREAVGTPNSQRKCYSGTCRVSECSWVSVREWVYEKSGRFRQIWPQKKIYILCCSYLL